MNSFVFDRIQIFHVNSGCVGRGICAGLIRSCYIAVWSASKTARERGSFICTALFSNLPEKVIIHEDRSLDEYIIYNNNCYEGASA